MCLSNFANGLIEGDGLVLGSFGGIEGADGEPLPNPAQPEPKKPDSAFRI